jgi:hypothetical protein
LPPLPEIPTTENQRHTTCVEFPVPPTCTNLITQQGLKEDKGIKQDTEIAPPPETSMDLTYRFRYLFYFAAFILVMSVCFVYAEPAGQPHLLFQVAPQHSCFLAVSSPEPTFDPSALQAAVEPSITPQMLQRVLTEAHPRHSLLHRGRRLPLQLGPVLQRNESSVLPASPRTVEGSARQ